MNIEIIHNGEVPKNEKIEKTEKEIDVFKKIIELMEENNKNQIVNNIILEKNNKIQEENNELLKKNNEGQMKIKDVLESIENETTDIKKVVVKTLSDIEEPVFKKKDELFLVFLGIALTSGYNWARNKYYKNKEEKEVERYKKEVEMYKNKLNIMGGILQRKNKKSVRKLVEINKVLFFNRKVLNDRNKANSLYFNRKKPNVLKKVSINIMKKL